MEKLFQRLAPSCAMVLMKNPATAAVEFLGSAFVVREDGYLFTAAEVVKDREEVLISPAEDALGFQAASREKLRCFAAAVVARNPRHNLALLKLTDAAALKLPPDLLGETETLHPGAVIMYLGFPFGRHGSLALTARSGILVAKVLSPEGVRQLIVEGSMYSGSAGGPVIDVQRGRIVGVLTSQLALLPREGDTERKLVLPIQTDMTLAAPIEAGLALLPAA
ncbi:MAG TPA: serine protease [Gammaproteobacteria bacterium]|jgi:serine protease Do